MTAVRMHAVAGTEGRTQAQAGGQVSAGVYNTLHPPIYPTSVVD